MQRSETSSKDDVAAGTLAVSASLFDRRDRDKVRNYASFVAGSVRRHRLLVATAFVCIVGAAVASFFVLPKTYHVEAKALAQPNSALTVRGDGPGADSLTRVAADTVLRQESLLALIQETNLLQYTRDHRAPVQLARDALLVAVHAHQDSEGERLDGLVRLLEKKLSVWTSDSGNTASGSTVTIAIDWPDGPMACRLVDAAQRAFLDARYAREITALAESIEILRRHTTTLQADIDTAVRGIQRMRAPGVEPAPAPTGPAAAAHASVPRLLPTRRTVAPRAAGVSPDLQLIQTQIDAKQRAIEQLEGLRRQRLSELQAQLAEARTTYTESHPTITNLKQSIAAISVESPQVAGLRTEAEALRAEYDSKGAVAEDLPAPAIVWTVAPPGLAGAAAAAPPQVPGDVLRLALDLREDRDPGMVYARGQLRDAMDKYAALRNQIQTAQIDLETAQAAFKYRYTVVTPARLPKQPTVPNVPMITLAALVAGLLCGILLAVVADIRRGRVLERWQLERLLDRPIVGDIVLPEIEGA